jgi:hypothetical protein
MNLTSLTVTPPELAQASLESMRELMTRHYEGVSDDSFRQDLFSKQWVILLLREETLVGFSTQVLFEHQTKTGSVRVLFSGDTIIDKAHWGSTALPIAWGRLMLSIYAADPATSLYWLLTSKGYKTYRFLPVFFDEFYPSCNAPTPELERVLLEEVALNRFGTRFDARTGILRAAPGAQRLRNGIAELDETRLQDPHIAFFRERNPGHAKGDELVCLARFWPGNLKPFIRRRL